MNTYTQRSQTVQKQSAAGSITSKNTAAITDNRPEAVTQLKLKSSLNTAEVTQLSRWKLTDKDKWTGIDPENLGMLKTHPSGSSVIGTVWEDSNDTSTSPTSPNGYSIPSGSYGDWRKVVRPEEQVDHFPPNASYTGTPYEKTSYNHRPAFPIRNREGHRPPKGEEYGYGGHVSTTNSTFVQKEYTPELNKMMKSGDFAGALYKELVDKSNVALYQYGDRSAFNELLKPGIQLSRDYKWINDTEHFKLLSLLEEFKKYPKG